MIAPGQRWRYYADTPTLGCGFRDFIVATMTTDTIRLLETVSLTALDVRREVFERNRTKELRAVPARTSAKRIKARVAELLRWNAKPDEEAIELALSALSWGEPETFGAKPMIQSAVATFTRPSDAARAARTRLGKPDAREGVDYSIERRTDGTVGLIYSGAKTMKMPDKLTNSPSAKMPSAIERQYGVTTPAAAKAQAKARILESGAVTTAANHKPTTKPAKKPTKAPKPKKAPRTKPGKKKAGARAKAEADAAAGKLPKAPDFKADTHKPWRARLAETIALVAKKDVKALKALSIPTYSSSPKAIARYRDLAVIALEAAK